MVDNPDPHKLNKLVARAREEIVKRPGTLPVKYESQVDSYKHTVKAPDARMKEDFKKVLTKIDKEVKSSKLTNQEKEKLEKNQGREELGKNQGKQELEKNQGKEELETNHGKEELETNQGKEELEKREELNNVYIISKGDHAVVRILISVLILGFALAGFWLLSLSQAVLWFLFLFVAYPLCLAFTTNAQQLERVDLIRLYEIGMSQVPLIGNLLAKFFFPAKDSSKDLPKDS